MNGMTANLSPILQVHLLELEKRLGIELTVNSGYRDPEHNRDVGGVEDSEHTHDPADGADVMCLRSVTRYKLIKEALDIGISRIGIGKDFVHIGVADDLPQLVLWTYYK